MGLFDKEPCKRKNCPYYSVTMKFERCKHCEHNPNAGWGTKRKWWIK